MRTKIKDEELNAVSDYLRDKGGIEAEFNPHGEYSTHETGVVFPAIRKLIKYAVDKHPNEIGTRDQSYKYMSEWMEKNDPYVRTLVVESHHNISALIANYKLEANAEKRDALFQVKISDMTGYQFQEYLRHIGLIK